MPLKKLWQLSFIFFLPLMGNYAQKSQIDPNHIENLTKRIDGFLTVLTENELTLIRKYADINPFIAEHWDNDKINPYGKPNPKAPFNLIFEDSIFASPVLFDKVITSRYGWRNRRPHKGIDIDLVTGDSVRALLHGKVRYVKTNRGYGKNIIIRHSNGLEMIYAHLSKQLVKENQLISKGQIIGKGGTSGNARGSHLHLEVIYKGNHINPEYLFDFSDKNKIRNHNIWVNERWINPYQHSSKRQSKIDVASTLDEANAQKTRQITMHKIRRGDSLSRIAVKYGVTISYLCRINGIKRSKILRTGRYLKVIQ